MRVLRAKVVGSNIIKSNPNNTKLIEQIPKKKSLREAEKAAKAVGYKCEEVKDREKYKCKNSG